MTKRVVIVGAGFSGLAAAYELVQRGYRPVVLEAEPEVGGLAAAFLVDGTRIERFYHHWFTNDHHIGALVHELGLGDRLVYKQTRTGMYFANRLYRLSTPFDVLRLPVLSLTNRLRLGFTLLRARLVSDWRDIDHLGAAEWMRKLGGEATFRVVWEPLLRNKFGPTPRRSPRLGSGANCACAEEAAARAAKSGWHIFGADLLRSLTNLPVAFESQAGRCA